MRSERIEGGPRRPMPRRGGERATWHDLEAARRRILLLRRATLLLGGEGAQELAARYWDDAVALEGAISRMRWPS